MLPKLCRRPRPSPPEALPGPSASLLLAPHHQQTRSGELAAASQQPTACNYQPSVFQHLRKGSGGRRPKALKSGHRALRAKGTAVAKRYGGGGSSSCRSFKPFPNKLVYSRFPPGSGRLRPDPVLLQWRCFRVFLTCQTGRHRRCPKRAPRGLQEGTKRSPKEPSDHQLPPVFLVLRTQETHGNKQHQKAAITGVLVQSRSPKNAQREPKEGHQIASYHRCSWFCIRKNHIGKQNTKRQLSPVFLCSR